ncbi:hypothetical protein PR202_gb22839 [Eleusine coracana subsp. coracana]|uniref:F-box domain-containing protein n=1 Tax=Eleusine coracana subsp. coracana TaxID=191504 RepID=A0AAV5FIA2_ELECO|nr:hypothetical protein PR202_gb22839 [Eleusine coracana subsp. coracana]
MYLQSMPVDIQEHILLQLDSPICLVCASTTCKLWRRIIAGTVFLKRFRSLHKPPVVGYYHQSDQSPASVRSFKPSPQVTTAIASRYDSLDHFLPLAWLFTGTVKDSRGSLLLVEIATMKEDTLRQHLYVVEPLTQQSKAIAVYKATTPAIPCEIQAFLLDGAKPGEIGMSNFRVVCLSKNGTVAGIITQDGPIREVKTGNDHGKYMGYLGSAAGSMYWYTKPRTVFAFDKTTAEFSSSSLPDTDDFVQPTISTKFAVTAGRDGQARIVFLAGDTLKIFARPKPRSGDDWVLEKSVQQPSAVTLGVPRPQRFTFGRSVPLC